MLPYRFRIVTILIVLLALFSLAPGASAGTLLIPGEIADGDQNFIPPHGGTCTLLAATSMLLDIYSFRVTAADVYTIETTAGGTLDDTYLVLYDGPVNPADALENCAAEDDDGGYSTLSLITHTLHPGVTYHAMVLAYWPADRGTYFLNISGAGDAFLYTDPDPDPAQPAERPPFAFTDGRINRYDAAAPFAVYPHIDDEGALGLIIYDAYTAGNVLLVVSAEEIAAVPEHSANTLIASSGDGRVAVYRLKDGSFQVQGITYNNKVYVLLFGAIDSTADYTSHEAE